jgi:4-hydroxy-tetrahydrodipicolinate synthase
MNSLLSGVTVPLVTPLTLEEQLDTAGLGRLIDYVLAGGVHNLFIYGTNGEFQAFGVSELESMTTITRQILMDRKANQTLLVGVGAASLRSAIERGRAAIRSGADALVACSPYYFIYSAQELEGYFLRLADQLDRPIILYNCPRYTNNPLTPAMVATLAKHPNIIGIKDSSGSHEQVMQLLAIAAQHPGFLVSQGDESKLSWAVRMGAHGITPGLANVAPGICVQLWENAMVNNGEADKAQTQLDQLRGIHRIRSGISGTKAALAELGLIGPNPVAPFTLLDAAERRVLREILALSGIFK